MSLSDVHSWLSDALLFYTLLTGLWGLLNFIGEREVSLGYWGALAMAQMLVMSQGLLGGLLWLQDKRPAQGIHVIYGTLAALGLPLIYAITRGREGRRESLAYGVALLLVALLVWGAAATT